MKWVGLVAGGITGTFLRVFAQMAAARLFPGPFPYGTLVVNTLGCFVIGILAGIPETMISEDIRWLLIAGFCGAFTTFSSVILEASSMNKSNAFFYVAATLFAGFAAFKCGTFLVSAIKIT